MAVTAGTVYPLLARLKTDGLLESNWVEGEAIHPRKYYELTPEGRSRAIEMARSWSKFSSGLDVLLSSLLKEGR